MCSALSLFLTSDSYKSQSSQGQLDSILLSHFIAEHIRSGRGTNTYNVDDFNDPISVYFSLLPSKSATSVPPICLALKNRPLCHDLCRRIFQRFDNNNFAVHRQLTTIAHGIFPLASRLFNHSCMPNAVTVYMLSARGILLQVRALRTILEGEEVSRIRYI